MEIGRRDALADQATDYVLDHGVARLSLRPLAAALGTSDRMLIYHFGSKASLVAEVIERSNARSVALLDDERPAAGPREAVVALWQLWRHPTIARCNRIYVQSAALGLLGDEPYLSAARHSNDAWRDAVNRFLIKSRVDEERVVRIGALVDFTLFGLFVDQPVDAGESFVDQVVHDLADAAQRISDS